MKAREHWFTALKRTHATTVTTKTARKERNHMAVTTVAQLAAELNRPAAALLEQLQSAGVSKASTDDALTETDKERLLDHLRTSHGTAAGGERKKITLTRKSTSEIKQADSSGKARTIQVEVRKKRTFVKRDERRAGVDEAAVAAAASRPSCSAARKRRTPQAELLRRQEEELAEQRRQREEQEQRRARGRRGAPRRGARRPPQQAAAAAAAAAPAEDRRRPRPRRPATRPPPRRGRGAAPRRPSRRSRRCAWSRPADVENEEKQRAADLAKRRKAAEDEAAAIRAMMAAPKKVLVAKKPEEAKPAEAAKEGIKGTIHKKAGAPGAPRRAGARPSRATRSRSSREKLSSSWADDAAKKRAPQGRRARHRRARGRAGWRAPRAGRRGERNDGAPSTFVAPAELQVQEVHVPETISVADLAHKMSVKASEVIKQLMKLGQMVTINQQLDQETAMIVVEEMGHKALAAKLDDPEAFLEEETEADSAARAAAARAGRHRDGPRRPRQDLAARLHPHAPASPPARPAASRSTSAPTTSRRRAA